MIVLQTPQSHNQNWFSLIMLLHENPPRVHRWRKGRFSWPPPSWAAQKAGGKQGSQCSAPLLACWAVTNPKSSLKQAGCSAESHIECCTDSAWLHKSGCAADLFSCFLLRIQGKPKAEHRWHLLRERSSNDAPEFHTQQGKVLSSSCPAEAGSNPECTKVDQLWTRELHVLGAKHR